MKYVDVRLLGCNAKVAFYVDTSVTEENGVSIFGTSSHKPTRRYNLLQMTRFNI
jgi:hypothetical protein